MGQEDIEMSAPGKQAQTASSGGGMTSSVIGIVSGILGFGLGLAITFVALANEENPDPVVEDAILNYCAGTKPTASGWDNFECIVDNVVLALEQAGGNVTLGWEGQLNASAAPISTTLKEAGLCPVNVHWHLGAEHLSVGEYDEGGDGPASKAGETRLGGQCYHYDSTDSRFTTEYDWQFCTGMRVGETYEVHWPHSALGACNTPLQYQTPFYDGVFCNYASLVGNAVLQPQDVASAVGVQGQVFTIINDEDYYDGNLIRGMLVKTDSQGQEMGQHITAYTGSTTGTSRDNDVCSRYSPITWHVDRKCHLISASSFDKMCQDMLTQVDDMSEDVYAHGSREVVAGHLNADNQIDLDVYHDVQ